MIVPSGYRAQTTSG